MPIDSRCRTVRRTSTLALLLALSLLSAAPAPPAGAQTAGEYRDEPGLPEGAAGERVQEVLEAVNGGDPEALRRLVETAFAPEFRDAVPMEHHLAVLGDLHRRSGGFELHGVRRYDEPQTGPDGLPEHVVIVRNRLTEAWQAFVLTVEPEPPHRIAGLRLTPARPPKDLPPPGPLTEAELVAELRAFVERLAEADVFSGTVLLARDRRDGEEGSEVLLQGAWGEASRRYGVPNRIDTKFNLGSMNKMFTAVAVAQLAERGKLSLDDPLSKYVGEDWLPREVTERIRLEHLLTHTSGLGSYFNDEFFRSSRALYRELEDYKPLIRIESGGEPPAFEPGTDWSYSNTGMFLLGVVIEKASGQSYFEYVQENVHRPAGMTGTACYDMDRPVPNLAMGYTREGGEWVENTFLHVIRGGPAGGGFSTAPDLAAFARALRQGKLVSRETAERMWSPKPEISSPGYGYGFQLGGTPEDRIVGHGGGFPGISSNLDLFLDSGYTAVVLTNLDGGAQPVQQKIRELVARLGG